MFNKHATEGYATPVPGIRQKTISHGSNTLMAEFLLTAGAQLPEHAHPHEQTGYLVSGHIRLTIGAVTHDVLPGDSWCIAGDVSHRAEIVDDSVAIEVFSPVRTDLLPTGRQNL